TVTVPADGGFHFYNTGDSATGSGYAGCSTCGDEDGGSLLIDVGSFFGDADTPYDSQVIGEYDLTSVD
ncbi:MAG: hypothetical protein JWP74_3068, partial [Marmoricola sp.]|nr:hypothetical protein [Marmoricola sp.]